MIVGARDVCAAAAGRGRGDGVAPRDRGSCAGADHASAADAGRAHRLRRYACDTAARSTPTIAAPATAPTATATARRRRDCARRRAICAAGIYKFGSVAAGQLPTDDDFVRIIRGGLHGTAMLAWDVPPPSSTI